MAKVAIICVGKIRASFWREAVAHYLQLLAPWRTVSITEIRDKRLGTQGLAQEGEEILAKLAPQDFPIVLDAGGQVKSSPQFAQMLRDCDEKKMKRPAFIIGGPWGLAAAVLDRCPLKISLSAMTWPHELARVLLLEQLYRAENILRGGPYHH